MIKLPRICIPIGLECNLSCRYCFRDKSRRELPSKISNLMKDFLRQLDPETCEVVCINGGEPLLYFEIITELFSYVPNNIHKKIITNGTLLTPEIVDYINNNNIELCVSHDGKNTQYLRGVDILKDSNIVKLLNQVHTLTIQTVVTQYSNDIMDCYNYIVNSLGRCDFHYIVLDFIETGCNEDLIQNFDYDLFTKSYREYLDTVIQPSPNYYRISLPESKQRAGFNIDLEGNVIGISTLLSYGTVLNTYSECLQEKSRIDETYCKSVTCPYIGNCLGTSQNAGPHYCKCIRIRSGRI